MELGYIKSLVDNKTPENKHLEYKRALNINTDSDKKEFLYDVSSFANAAGGQLIFGIKEGTEKGVPDQIDGIVGNADDLIRRMDNLIRDGVAPRILNYKVESVLLNDGCKFRIILTPSFRTNLTPAFRAILTPVLMVA